LFSTAEYRSEFDDERTAALMYGSGETPQEEVRIAIDATEEQLNSLRTIRQRVELLDAFPLANVVTRKTTPSANAVFVVHGRDESAKHSIARFLEQIGLSPIILHEQPDKGRTIIQKFEDHTDVVFAVVLLTPDDEGRLWGSSGGLSLRARQNVILELGYFIGKLGRARVCALKGDGVEEPSDLHGVLYIPLDSGDAWRLTLARELKAAGLNVDMNKVV